MLNFRRIRSQLDNTIEETVSEEIKESITKSMLQNLPIFTSPELVLEDITNILNPDKQYIEIPKGSIYKPISTFEQKRLLRRKIFTRTFRLESLQELDTVVKEVIPIMFKRLDRDLNNQKKIYLESLDTYLTKYIGTGFDDKDDYDFTIYLCLAY